MHSGLLRDVTEEVARTAGVHAASVEKDIKRGAWFAAQKHPGRTVASAAPEGWAKPVHVSIPYIPVGLAPHVARAIPDGSVLNLVREASESKPVVVAHQALVVRDGDQVLIRHSSRKGYIRTQSLLDYLRDMRGQGAREGWPLLGFNLNALVK